MGFTLSDEQEQLVEAVRRFMEAKSPSVEVRRLMETDEGYDRAVWQQMAGELGLQGLHIPEEHGGQGFGFEELGVVLEQMGRVLLCAPFFSTAVLAGCAILNAGSAEDQQELLPGIAAGATLASLALTEPGGRWGADGIAMEARAAGDEFLLSGEKLFVLDGHIADLVVVAARLPGTAGEEGVGLYVVHGDAAGLTRDLQPTMDLTRKQARLRFDDVRARRLGGGGWAPVATTLRQASVCLANEMVGGAQRALEMAVEYAGARLQFGRPIGSFQAVKHKCADVFVAVESAKSAAYYARWAAKSAAYYARWAATHAGEELAVMASAAHAYCSEAYVKAAADNIQVHGGIGFTWEHDAHLYLKRAKSCELLLGDPRHHRSVVADHVGF